MNATHTQAHQPPLMKLAEVAEVLNIGRKTAYEMAHGPLAHLVVRVGAKQTGIRIVRAGFAEWVESQGKGARRG